MTHFLVRVELREAVLSDGLDQVILDAAMQCEGFSRWVAELSGAAFLLPLGEYHIAGEFTRRDVLERAGRVASVAGLRCAVLVTEAVGFLWQGLDPVPEGDPCE